MIREHLLWSRGAGEPLVFLIPGGTGSASTSTRGYLASAGYLWLHGCSCYLAETAGQDQHPGAFSIARCLEECRQTLDALTARLAPSAVILFGSCSGGTVATHLAAEREVDWLVLWETLPRYSESDKRAFVDRTRGRVALSENFLGEYLATIDRSDRVTCPVLYAFGADTPQPLIESHHVDELETAFSTASIFERLAVEATDHNLPRGSNPAKLKELLNYVASGLDRLRRSETLDSATNGASVDGN
jgi:dienelactone hydrolase